MVSFSADVSVLLPVFEYCEKVFVPFGDGVLLKIKEDGWHIVAVDPAHVIVGTVFVPKEKFTEYISSPPCMDMEIKLDSIVRYLNKMPDKASVTLTINGSINPDVEISVRGSHSVVLKDCVSLPDKHKTASLHKLPLVDFSKTKTAHELMIRAGLLKDIFDWCGNEEIVEITAIDYLVIFSSTFDNGGKAEWTVTRSNGLTEPTPIKSRFSTTYLRSVLKFLKAPASDELEKLTANLGMLRRIDEDEVSILLGDYYPMRWSFVRNDVKYEFMVAPRIDND